MAPSGPDASNSCLPPSAPVVVSVPPVPSTTRGERCTLDGKAGRLNSDKTVLAYASGKLVVARTLEGETLLPHTDSKLPVLVYRGHHYPVTAMKLSPSGAYVASGDERGMLRVWAFDHEEHLCKYDKAGLTGPMRDADWDGESKRIAIAGERADPRSDCARVLQWDTGVTVGQLSAHIKGRVASIAFKPDRPYRIVTAGKEDHKCCFHKGPPFQKVNVEDGVPAENIHTKGGVNCVRYNSKGTMVVTVGTDRSICTYEGKTFAFLKKLDNVHTATIYSCAWSGDDKQVMTASGDGTCKLFDVADDGGLTEVHTWNPAEIQLGKTFEKVPVGGNQLGCTFVKGATPVSVGLNGQLTILPVPGSSDAPKVLTGHSTPIADMAVDHANGVFYTGDTDGILCKWDLNTCQPLCRLEPAEGNDNLQYIVHGGAISGLTTTSDGSLLSVGWDDKLFITDKSGKVGLTPLALGAQPNSITSGTDLSVIVTVEGLLLVKNGKLSDMIKLPYAAKAVCVSKDDKTVYVGGDDNKIHVYEASSDAASLNEQHVIEAHRKAVEALALSNDGSKLASADAQDVSVFDLKENYKPIIGKGRWCFHVQRITCLSWSPDDKVVVSGGADDSVYLWSLEKKMKRIHYQYSHRGGLTAVHCLPKATGVQFLSVGNDAVVNQFDATKDVAEKFA